MVFVKITLETPDKLLVRARRHAEEAGKPLRAVAEEGLRNILPPSTSRSHYILPGLRVGGPERERLP